MSLEFRYVNRTEDHLEPIDYVEAWELQKQIHDEVAAGGTPQVLFLEHPPTYTAGRRTEHHERPVDGTPVVDVDRGGKITWHGPGQLVGYPIITLPDGVGVVDYVRRVEEAVIRLMTEYGIPTGRVPGRSGVWLEKTADKPERKICAIGIRVSANTTMHGFALNVRPDMTDFGKIVPCGIADAGVAAMASELENCPSLVEVAEHLEPYLREMLAWEPYEQSPDIKHVEASEGVQLGLTV